MRNRETATTPLVQRGSLFDHRVLSRHAQSYAFFMPAFLVVGMVSLIPILYAVRQSFYASDFLELGTFVGLDNFVRLLTRGAAVENLWRSFVYVAGTVVFSTLLGFVLALLLSRDVRFRVVFRTVLIIPWVVSQLITALLWMWMLNNRMGPIAPMLAQVGIGLPNPTTDPSLAMPSLILANTWRSYPLVMVFVLAALQTVPVELVDSAQIDGASRWQTFWQVKFPLIRNTTLVALVLTTLNTFNMVTLILVMTGGGPADSTHVLALRVFKEGFQSYRMGMASAAALIIFVVNVLFTFAYIRVLRTDTAVS